MQLAKVRQHFEAPMVSDLDARVQEEGRRLLQESGLEPGWRVATTAGSRGIRKAVEAYRAVVGTLRDEGLEGV